MLLVIEDPIFRDVRRVLHLRPQDLSGRTLWLWCLLALGGEP